MRKLKLNVEDVAVESFAPVDANVGKGTVVAHNTEFEVCGSGASQGVDYTCEGWITCHGVDTCNRARTCDIRLATCGGPSDVFCG